MLRFSSAISFLFQTKHRCVSTFVVNFSVCSVWLFWTVGCFLPICRHSLVTYAYTLPIYLQVVMSASKIGQG